MPNFEIENSLNSKGFKKIVGIDEVGRGALVGPLVVCAVLFENNHTNLEIFNLINDSKIDEILEVYGKYKPQITNWLRKKNPEKFTSEENQQSFLQVLVWAYTGGEYKEILEMLAKDVYGGDINKAKQWLDGIYDQAKLISEYVKNKDYTGLLIYIGLNDKVENFMKKNEKTINNVKGRLKGLLSN